MEIWKNIKRWDGGLYEISSSGKVRRNGRILKPSTVAGGYKQVTASLFGNRTIRHALVHRLVAEEFLGGIPDSMQINHRNGIRYDNRVENLEVVTASENNLHAYRVLGRSRPQGSKHPRAKLTEEIVLEIRRLFAEGVRQVDLARKYKIDKTTVRDLVHRYRWKHI